MESASFALLTGVISWYMKCVFLTLCSAIQSAHFAECSPQVHLMIWKLKWNVCKNRKSQPMCHKKQSKNPPKTTWDMVIQFYNKFNTDLNHPMFALALMQGRRSWREIEGTSRRCKQEKQSWAGPRDETCIWIPKRAGKSAAQTRGITMGAFCHICRQYVPRRISYRSKSLTEHSFDKGHGGFDEQNQPFAVVHVFH